MPPQYTAVRTPSYDSSVDAQASSRSASYAFFRPHVGRTVEFYKPTYDKRKKPVTVVRPFACRSFEDPMNSFMPYRMDPSGKNFFGWWMKRIHVAWNVGNPATSFILHNPEWGPFDARLTPLSILVRAIKFAVKKGQGKADSWNSLSHRQPVFEPHPKMVLEWGGLTEGAENTGAQLTGPKDLYLIQGYIPMLGGEPMFGPGKAPPGWGNGPTAVFGMTSGLGETLIGELSKEVENYRGDPADFEHRYVNGDPVAPEHGRFIYIYAKGGDPRQNRLQSQPVTFNPLEELGGNTGWPGEKQKEEMGFSCHLEKDFQKMINAQLNTPTYRALMRDKWKHWDDVRDENGNVVEAGILDYPDYKEQAQRLARILPASMVVYAFHGEHTDWLTKDTIQKAQAALQGTAEQIRPTGRGPVFDAMPGQPPAGNGFSVNPDGWQQSPPAPTFQPPVTGMPAGSSPLDVLSNGVPDSSLPTPPSAGGVPDPLAMTPGSVDAMLAEHAAQADALFGAPPPNTPPVPPGLAGKPAAAEAPVETNGFDPPPAKPLSAAALAAAKANKQ